MANLSVITATGFYGNDERLTATWLRRAVEQFDAVVRAELDAGREVLVVGNGGSWGHAVPALWWASETAAALRGGGRCTFELHTCDPESVDGKRLATSHRMMINRCTANPISTTLATTTTTLYPNFRDRDRAISGLLRTWNDIVCVFAMDPMAKTSCRPDRYFRVHERKADSVRSRWFVPHIADDTLRPPQQRKSSAVRTPPSRATTIVAAAPAPARTDNNNTSPLTTLEQCYWSSQEKVCF